mmetsp:Transcript_68001/g.202416  ORF Transcript_68001/g.202416 Transcript_68001/m.202416 type:complete len:252 (-) Transcript_68001:54-809(-)
MFPSSGRALGWNRRAALPGGWGFPHPRPSPHRRRPAADAACQGHGGGRHAEVPPLGRGSVAAAAAAAAVAAAPAAAQLRLSAPGVGLWRHGPRRGDLLCGAGLRAGGHVRDLLGAVPHLQGGLRAAGGGGVELPDHVLGRGGRAGLPAQRAHEHEGGPAHDLTPRCGPPAWHLLPRALRLHAMDEAAPGRLLLRHDRHPARERRGGQAAHRGPLPAGVRLGRPRRPGGRPLARDVRHLRARGRAAPLLLRG